MSPRSRPTRALHERELIIDDGPSKWDLGDVIGLSALETLAGPYVPWSQWSLRPTAVATLVNAILVGGLETVVELGSGASTVYLGRALRETGGSLVSFEQDAGWAEAIGSLIERDSLSGVVTIVHAPLEALARPSISGWPANAPTAWYSERAVRDNLVDGIELLLVDGPAAGESLDELVRLPAVPLLSASLSDQFTIVLDDLDREAEREIIARWGTWLELDPVVYTRTDIGVLSNRSGHFPAL